MSKLTRTLRNNRGRYINARPEVMEARLPANISGQMLRDDLTLRRRMTAQYGTEPVMKRMASDIPPGQELSEAKKVFQQDLDKAIDEIVDQTAVELAYRAAGQESVTKPRIAPPPAVDGVPGKKKIEEEWDFGGPEFEIPNEGPNDVDKRRNSPDDTSRKRR